MKYLIKKFLKIGVGCWWFSRELEQPDDDDDAAKGRSGDDAVAVRQQRPRSQHSQQRQQQPRPGSSNSRLVERPDRRRRRPRCWLPLRSSRRSTRLLPPRSGDGDGGGSTCPMRDAMASMLLRPLMLLPNRMRMMNYRCLSFHRPFRCLQQNLNYIIDHF